MEDFKEVVFELQQGEIVVNEGFENPGKLKALIFDLKSKYADILSWGTDDEVPVVYLWATEDTLKIDEEKKGEPTCITLTEYEGWNVLSATVTRYTLTIVLINRNDAAI